MTAHNKAVYNSDTWKRLRRYKLWLSPLCEPCKRRGRAVSATVVDHIHAISDGGPAFPGLDGLMSMCAPCHNTKTNALEREGGKGVAFKGCDVDGLPIDAAHPFYQDQGITPSKDGNLSAED